MSSLYLSPVHQWHQECNVPPLIIHITFELSLITFLLTPPPLKLGFAGFVNRFNLKVSQSFISSQSVLSELNKLDEVKKYIRAKERVEESEIYCERKKEVGCWERTLRWIQNVVDCFPSLSSCYNEQFPQRSN